MTHGLGLAVWAVGLVMGVRNLATGTIWDAALHWDLAWLPWAALGAAGGTLGAWHAGR